MADIEHSEKVAAARWGAWFSFATSFLCLLTFFFAIQAVPPVGSYCVSECAEYPFHDIGLRFPIDFMWMYVALALAVCTALMFLMLLLSVSANRRVSASVSFFFVAASSLILFGTYFVQVTVLPAQLLLGRTEALVVFSQYDEHGAFIALEDAGYLLLSFGLGLLWAIFRKGDRFEKWIAWLGGFCLVATLSGLAYYSFAYGLLRGYRFEVAAISINWLGLVIVGVLLGFWFRRQTIS